jgi:hypothetical protein
MVILLIAIFVWFSNHLGSVGIMVIMTTVDTDNFFFILLIEFNYLLTTIWSKWCLINPTNP